MSTEPWPQHPAHHHLHISDPAITEAELRVTDLNDPSLRHRTKNNEKTHCWLGITSIALTPIWFSILAFTVILATVLPQSTDDWVFAIITLTWLGLFCALLLSAALGIASLFRKKKKRLLSVLGIGLNTALLAALTALLIVGAITVFNSEDGELENSDYKMVMQTSLIKNV